MKIITLKPNRTSLWMSLILRRVNIHFQRCSSLCSRIRGKNFHHMWRRKKSVRSNRRKARHCAIECNSNKRSFFVGNDSVSLQFLPEVLAKWKSWTLEKRSFRAASMDSRPPRAEITCFLCGNPLPEPSSS